MTSKKITKQLMAIGVQRNDAEAFARAYRKVMDAKREDLFPEIVKSVMPVVPVVHTAIDYRVTPFRAVYMAPAYRKAFSYEERVTFEKWIQEKLSREIAEGLMNNGYIRMSMEETPGVGTHYFATVHVAKPWV